MKRRLTTFLFLVSLGSASQVQAQTFNEWFRQRRTQLRYLARQNLLLQQQHHVLRSGYALLDEGLQVVDSLKTSDYTQHQGYFQSLRLVATTLINAPSHFESRGRLTEIESLCRRHDGPMYVAFREKAEALLRAYDLLLRHDATTMDDAQRSELLLKWSAAVNALDKDVRAYLRQDDVYRLQQQREQREIDVLRKINQR